MAKVGAGAPIRRAFSRHILTGSSVSAPNEGGLEAVPSSFPDPVQFTYMMRGWLRYCLDLIDNPLVGNDQPCGY